MVNRSSNSNTPWIVGSIAVAGLIYLSSRLAKKSAENFVPTVDPKVSQNSAMECQAIALRIKQICRDTWFSISWDEASDILNELYRIKDVGGAQMVVQAFGNLSAWTATGSKSGDIFFWLSHWLNQENQDKARPYFYGLSTF